MFDYYQIANMLGSVIVPGAQHTINNPTTAYFAKYLLEKAVSLYKWELPKTWDKDYFLYVLYVAGFVGVINAGPKYGIVPQWGTLDGYNLYYAPRKFRYSNPLIGGGGLVIHEECELIKLQGNYTGIWDLILYYASKMALLSEAFDMNAANVKTSRIFFVKSKAAAETLKKLADKVQSGQVITVLDKELLDENGKFTAEWFNDDLNKNYICDKLLIELRKLENEFCTDLGIPNSNTDKKERLITDEVNSNNTETMLRADLWLDRLKECCEAVNKMYDLNISVDWRVKPDDGNIVNSWNAGNGPYNFRGSDNTRGVKS